MSKFQCKICQNVQEEINDDSLCLICGSASTSFDEVDKPVLKDEENKRVWIAHDNPSIARIFEKCINCGNCQNTCLNKVGIEYEKDQVTSPICLNCGQCILSCPTGALVPKYNYKKVQSYINDTDFVVIVSTSPAVRVAIGDEFEFEPGTFLENKMVAALKQIGFDYVLDTTFGADLTVIEEASEFVSRLKDKENLPLITSCCPSWVKYAEIYHHELLDNLSTTKSPVIMQGAVIKTYFAKMMDIDPNKIIHVALTPCTAKKAEANRIENQGTDYVITTSELAMMIRENEIDLKEIKEQDFDHLMGKGSTAGLIFGNSGGVMESTLRTVYRLLNGKDMDLKKIELKEVRGLQKVKEAEIVIQKKKIKVAVVHGMKALESLLPSLSDYHFVEVMSCPGGCIGGGGQPLIPIAKAEEYQEARNKSLYENDQQSDKRYSYKNKDIINLYKTTLKRPLSKESQALLHTVFEPQEVFKKDLETSQ